MKVITGLCLIVAGVAIGAFVNATAGVVVVVLATVLAVVMLAIENRRPK